MKIRTIYPVVVVPLLGIIIVAAMLLLYLSPFTHATSATPRITLANTVSAVSICKGTGHCKLISAAPANQPIALALGLKLRNTDNLSAYLREITNPASPLYHHYLNAASFAAQYGPFPQSEASVASFLRSHGFKIKTTYANHLIVDAVGTVAQAAQALQVQVNNYRSHTRHP